MEWANWHNPGNPRFYLLYGLEQSLRAQDQHSNADLVHREFKAAWKRADVELSLDWF
jgi:hypothetical protein